MICCFTINHLPFVTLFCNIEVVPHDFTRVLAPTLFSHTEEVDLNEVVASVWNRLIHVWKGCDEVR